jgi:trimethylamine--corrinoid protein Co-methyltransferase
LPAFLAGANFMLHAAGWLESGLAMSYEKFVMDVDQLGAFHTLANGLALDENAFALGAFREIGPGRHYLGAQHTLQNYEHAYYDFELADNSSYEQWTQEGRRDLLAPAPVRWRSQLAGSDPPDLDAAGMRRCATTSRGARARCLTSSPEALGSRLALGHGHQHVGSQLRAPDC